MKKRFALPLSLALLLTLLWALPSRAEGPTVTAAGTATVSLAADTAEIQLGATTRGKTVREAQGLNDTAMHSVIEAVLALGIDRKDIITSAYNVMYNSGDWSYSSAPAEPFYEVSNMLWVTVRDMDLLGPVIDAASAAGANTFYGLVFSSSQGSAAHDRALTLAFENGREKAAVLAKAAGMELGALVSIQSDVYYGDGGARNAMMAMAEDARGTAVVSGEVTVTAGVTLVFSLK